MRVFLGLLLVFAFLASSRDADACSCIGPRVTAWPATDTLAPPNAHVFVRFPNTKKVKVIVRLAGTSDTDGIPSSRLDLVSMSVRFVELAPVVALPKDAKFEVVVGTGKDSRVVSTFAVGGESVKATPKRPDIVKTTYIHEEVVCCMCSSGQPHVSIQLAGKHDTEDSRIYGIWGADKDGKVDWDRKPLAYTPSWYGRLTLGDSSTCSVNNFPIPREGTVTLGVRAISQSGKRSKGRVIKVEATAKKRASLLRPQ